MSDPALELLEVRVERVLGWREGSAHAVVLEREGKRFLIFVGPYEGAAVRRELAGDVPERPLTHDLLDFVLRGFEIRVVKVVVSALVNEVFCATVTLERAAEAGGSRCEVRLDARASDAVVIALKASAPLFVTRRVFDAVEDMTPNLKKLEESAAGGSAVGAAAAGLSETDDDSPLEDLFSTGESAVDDDGEDPLRSDAGDDDPPADDGEDDEPESDDDRDRPLRGPEP
jgi:bifunctional DNase/RNase